jgi:hypothetical protein
MLAGVVNPNGGSAGLSEIYSRIEVHKQPEIFLYVSSKEEIFL